MASYQMAVFVWYFVIRLW